MTEYVIGTPQFIQNLDGWIGENKQSCADYLFRSRGGIPAMFKQYNSYLYRGMRVTEEQYESIQKNGLTFQQHLSWSKDSSQAKRFVNDPQKMLDRNKSSEKPVQIMIKKRISSSSIILDIHSLMLFMGIKQMEILGMDELSAESAMKEQEVLVSRGLRISKADVSQF